MSIELKPCPFCGGKEPEIVRYGTNRVSTQYECSECGASLETSEEWDHGQYWNRRPVEDELRAKIAELEAELAFSNQVYDTVKAYHIANGLPWKEAK